MFQKSKRIHRGIKDLCVVFWPQCPPAYQINISAYYLGQAVAQVDEVNEVEANARIEIDEDIDVGLGPSSISRRRAKNRDVAHSCFLQPLALM